VVVAVMLKKIRYGLSDNCIIEQKFPDEVVDLRSLPFPPYVLRELWVRTQNERVWRRFYILPDTTAEIEDLGTLPEHPLPGGVLEGGPVPDRYPPSEGGERRDEVR
jgi:hypothetical protein